MQTNGDDIPELGRDECLALTRSVKVGRVVYTRRALPAIQPVAFALDANGDVTVFTAPDSELAAAVRDAIVAFEVDGSGPAGTGWSVTIIGRAGTPPESSDHAGPWPAGSRARPVRGSVRTFRIGNRMMTGRRFALHAPEHGGRAA
ncbi:pyridoxamine 5'-phosphate oxidase family protein [Actinomadura sp. 21ATH]|uniref:pyridoxamine 5'-phosphate oxidase family protein n=1 Tax=Actinomadura sp. 21ATH TaxID=1735444 RepID=UPI0035BFD8AA